MEGIFITVEGLDGAGKTTQLQLLREWLQEQGYNPLFTREPGGTKAGDAIRDVLLNPTYTGLNPTAEALLYAASRAQLVKEVIKPALTAGKIVISDRFTDSSVAYQAYGRGLDRSFVEEISCKATGGLKPHLTLLLDLDPRLGKERREQRTADRLEAETQTFYERVYTGYQCLAQEEPERIKLISGQHSIQEVHRQIIEHISRLLKVGCVE